MVVAMSMDEVQSYEFEEEFKNTKEVVRIRISKKNRQHNGQKNMYFVFILTYKMGELQGVLLIKQTCYTVSGKMFDN